MKSESSLSDRVAYGAAVVATVWFAFAAVWGCCQIPGGGHLDGGSAGAALYALPIVRWGILYPSAEVFGTTAPPSPSTYYCHHPFGVHYLSALCLWIFGKRDFVIHLPAILMSVALPPLLYSIAKKHWGAAAGAAAACSYVVVPIAVGYANYHNVETMCIFGSLLFFWGLSHRRMGASLAGVVVTCFGDWVGYALLAPLLLWGFVRALVLPHWMTRRVDFRWYARWWAVCVAIAIGTACLWVGLFYKADRIGDWLGSAEARGGGAAVPLRAVLASRKDWLDFSFTPFAIGLGKLLVPVCFLRALVLRDDCELYALSVLFGAVLQYVAFRHGADVHIFWPHYFAAYFALAVGQGVAALRWLTSVVGRRFSPASAAMLTGWGTLALGMTSALAMTPDAVRSLPLWRRTGGRYDDHGSPIRSEIDMLAVVRAVVVPRTGDAPGVDAHPSIAGSWEQMWSLQRYPHRITDPSVGAPDVNQHPIWYGRPSEMSTEEQTRIAAESHVEAYGDAWVVDQRQGPAALDAFRVREREPNPFEWLIYGGWEPVRSIGRAVDPLLTWEWRIHLGQPADPPRAQAPQSLDDLRILYNIATFDGDAARASELRRRIVDQLDPSATAVFDQGVRLIGVRVTDGVRPRVEAWFEASGPTAGQAAFTVRSAVEATAPFSLIPPSTTERDMGALPPIVSTKLWRAGFLYRVEAVLNHRIGRERYWGAWTSRDGAAAPRRRDGQAVTVLATVT